MSALRPKLYSVDLLGLHYPFTVVISASRYPWRVSSWPTVRPRTVSSLLRRAVSTQTLFRRDGSARVRSRHWTSVRI